MANNAANVSVGKPIAAGGVWFADITATLPTDAVAALAVDFKSGGFIADDGLTNTIEQDWNDVQAWGGDTVLSTRTSRKETFQFGFIETTKDVLGEIYGSGNVSVDAGGDITVKHNSADAPYRVYVFDIALTGGRVKRIVVPRAKVTDIDDVTYSDGDPIKYVPTLWAAPDAQGNTAYEYISAVV